ARRLGDAVHRSRHPHRSEAKQSSQNCHSETKRILDERKVNEMNMPGFTAASSLSGRTQSYRADCSGTTISPSVMPQLGFGGFGPTLPTCQWEKQWVVCGSPFRAGMIRRCAASGCMFGNYLGHRAAY